MMSWWMAGAAAISVGSQVFGTAGTKASIENQQDWADYNARVQYGIDVNNIKAQTRITELNSALLLAATEASNAANSALIEYNAATIEQTALYNDLMYEEDLANLWTETGLDITLIGMQRQKERGSIEATQSASGTVMGEGSNADVIVDQMTQEALDKFIVKTGADIQARNINNARMQSLQEADQEIKRITFEGRVQNRTSSLNASLQSFGMLAQNEIATIAGMTDAEIRKTTGIQNNSNRADLLDSGANRDFVSGMLGIAANVVQQYGAQLTSGVTGGPSTKTETALPGAAPVSIGSGGVGGQGGTTTILAGNYKNLVT